MFQMVDEQVVDFLASHTVQQVYAQQGHTKLIEEEIKHIAHVVVVEHRETRRRMVVANVHLPGAPALGKERGACVLVTLEVVAKVRCGLLCNQLCLRWFDVC